MRRLRDPAHDREGKVYATSGNRTKFFLRAYVHYYRLPRFPKYQPLQVRNFPKLTEEEMPNPEADIEIVPQLEHCKSRHHNVWLGECEL